MTPRSFVVLVLAGVLSGCAGSRHTDETGPSAELTEFAHLLAGSFSNAEQAAADPAYFDARVHAVPIWRTRTDGLWLYVEQAITNEPKHPYRQRIYFLHEPEPGVMAATVYAMPHPEKWVGKWEDPGDFSELKIEELTIRDGCDIIVRRETDGVFSGGTEGTACASDARGAAYATTRVRITGTGFDAWDRGFDAAGAQVWGPTTGPYRFVRNTAEK